LAPGLAGFHRGCGWSDISAALYRGSPTSQCFRSRVFGWVDDCGALENNLQHTFSNSTRNLYQPLTVRKKKQSKKFPL
jgi:hypothetical protein